MDEPRFRDLVERHLEGRLTDEEAGELLNAIEADPRLRRRAVGEIALATVLSGLLRERPIDLPARVLAALRDPAEKTRLLRRVMDALPDPRGRTAVWRRAAKASAAAVIAAAALAVVLSGRVRPPGDAAPVADRTVSPVRPEDGMAGPTRARATSPGSGRHGDVVPHALSRSRPSGGPKPFALHELDPNFPVQDDAPDPGSMPGPVIADRVLPRSEPPSPVPVSIDRDGGDEPSRETVAKEPSPPAGSAPLPMTMPLPAVLARIESASADVIVTASGVSRHVSSGTPLQGGETLRIPDAASATVRFDDGSCLVAQGEAVLEFAEADRRDLVAPPFRVMLARGILASDVAPQPAGKPFVIATPIADAEVLGTRFTLRADATSTRLDVHEGRVRLMRRPDRADVLVAAGHYVVASRERPLIAVPQPQPGPRLEIRVIPCPREIDLTAEGSVDWMHVCWNETVRIVRKKGARHPLGGLRVLDAARMGGLASSPLSVAWTDGTPAMRGAGATAGLAMHGVLNGFQISAPADRTPRTLRIYAGATAAIGRLEAVLSDGSAAPATDLALKGLAQGTQWGSYVVQYAAAKDGQTLTVRLTAEPEAEDRRAGRGAAGVEEPGRRAADRDIPRRGEPAVVLQAVTLSDAVLEPIRPTRRNKE